MGNGENYKYLLDELNNCCRILNLDISYNQQYDKNILAFIMEKIKYTLSQSLEWKYLDDLSDQKSDKSADSIILHENQSTEDINNNKKDTNDINELKEQLESLKQKYNVLLKESNTRINKLEEQYWDCLTENNTLQSEINYLRISARDKKRII